jgi:DNA polymerase III subunit delta'
MSISAPGITRLLGHSEAEQTLARAWESGRLPHAWLLTGLAGIGKATLAARFAQTVLAGADPEATARRAAAGTHADLLTITRATDEKRQRVRTEIVLEDVRPISGFLRRTAAEGGWRVVIVDGVEHLNRHAANALLKLIEEPPGRALILLVCSAPGRLLPTIRSRCRTLRLKPLDQASMHEVLQPLLPNLDAGERQTLIELSDGSPGRALTLAADDGVALAGLVQTVLAGHDRRAALWPYELADTVLRRDNGFSTFIDLLAASICSTMRLELQGGSTGISLLSLRPAEIWAQRCEDLERMRDETERLNLDKRQALLTSLSMLSES